MGIAFGTYYLHLWYLDSLREWLHWFTHPSGMRIGKSHVHSAWTEASQSASRSPLQASITALSLFLLLALPKMPAIKAGYGGRGDVTPTTAASDGSSAAGSPSSSPDKRSLAKEEVLALQQDLIQEFSSPTFQKRLREVSSLHAAGKSAEYQKAQRQLVREVQRGVIPRYGFPCSDAGVEQMLLSVEDFWEDADVTVNRKIIEEQLSSCEVPAAGKEQTALPLGHDKKELGKRDIVKLLKSLQVSFSEPTFQEELAKLKAADKKSESDGFLQLSGRNELAFAIQVQLAPCFGFEASKQGVLAMISTCGKFLTDPEVSELFDAVNMCAPKL